MAEGEWKTAKTFINYLTISEWKVEKFSLSNLVFVYANLLSHQPITAFPIYAFVKINTMIQEKKVKYKLKMIWHTWAQFYEFCDVGCWKNVPLTLF